MDGFRGTGCILPLLGFCLFFLKISHESGGGIIIIYSILSLLFVREREKGTKKKSCGSLGKDPRGGQN